MNAPGRSEAGAIADFEPMQFMVAPQLVTLTAGHDPRAEAIRALRTHIVAQHIQAGRRALAVCTPSPGAGCTYIATNLAVALAQIGVRTLLVDADMYEPGVTDLIRPTRSVQGLAQCLADLNRPLLDTIIPEVMPNLSLLTSGGVTPNAQELLGSDRFLALMATCLREYDVTIIDTPPANRCSDARRVSTVVGYSLVVAARDKTFVDDVKTLVAQLEADHAVVVGTVLNGA